MSSVFKGDSIYKSGGGGGGGYKDGGPLVDADFIEVKNNTVSTYDNTARDPVNFYYEFKDGEVLSSIIELSTAVNSTVYVYVVKGGFYYLLGNVGGNTVSAGEDYKINVTGDSYSIEQVSGGGMQQPRIPIGQSTYGVAKITGANLYIMTENLNEKFSWSTRYGAYDNDESKRANGFGLLYDPLVIFNTDGSVKDDFKSQIPTGWRIPSFDDIQKILDLITNNASGVNKIKSVNFWNDTNGNNELKTNFLPSGQGYNYPTKTFSGRGSQCRIITSTISGSTMKVFSLSQTSYTAGGYNDTYWNDYSAQREYFAIRLVKDI